MNLTIAQPPEVLRAVLGAKGPSVEMPERWKFRLNWKAFLKPEDYLRAKQIELSGSLDDWLDPEENVYE